MNTKDPEIMEVQLTRGKVAIIDAADREMVSQFNWRAYPPKRKNSHTWYANTGRNPVRGMHQVIMGVPQGVEVDHRNGDGLDNRRANLRTATHSQNVRNQPKMRHYKGKPTSSRYKGVRKEGSKYLARIRPTSETSGKRGQQRRIGLFASEVEAARAYDAAARKYFGEFARLNFPETAEAPARREVGVQK